MLVRLLPALLLLLPCASAADGGQPENANSRYVVEGVHYPGKIDKRLRADIDKLVGGLYDEKEVERLATRMRRDLHVARVTHRLEKGTTPKHVRVTFEAEGRRFERRADIRQLAYHSKQGVSAGVELDFDVRKLDLGVGVFTDADTLLERYAGVSFRVARTFGNRVRLGFEHARTHQIWNGATRAAEFTNPAVAGVYRERESYRPEVTVALPGGLMYTAAVDVQHIQLQHPAVRTEAANSFANTLRLRREWETSGTLVHELEAGYNLRTATRVLDSDFVYARHLLEAVYRGGAGNHHVRLDGVAGTMSGTAPLFERFSLGDTERLRGWNKFDLDPLGGSRVAYGSATYRYRFMMVFYDAGTVWDRDEGAVVRHSAGFGIGGREWTLALAFPLRSGSAAPVFIVGTNF